VWGEKKLSRAILGDLKMHNVLAVSDALLISHG
jgi:hypothetical protein